MSLTTHVLDTRNGCPSAGMKIEIRSLDREVVLKSVRSS